MLDKLQWGTDNSICISMDGISKIHCRNLKNWKNEIFSCQLFLHLILIAFYTWGLYI